MKISIIICTYNRGLILQDTINSFYEMVIPKGMLFELLVIDNNSSDNTKNVVKRQQSSHTTLRYFFEATPGLSHARNRGIKEASGNIIAFVDDDVYFTSQWLFQLDLTFNDTATDCFGGRSEPVFEQGDPKWLTNKIKPIYGSTNSGETKKEMLFPEHPFGLNMAFQKHVFEKVGGFNPRLGRIGSNLLSNEEADIFYRISQAGLKTSYNPDALLYHRIPPDRTRTEWVLERYYWQGISEIAFNQIISPINKTQLIKQAFIEIGKTISHISGGNFNPRKAYWHYSKMPLEQSILTKTRLGRIRQLLCELGRPG